MQKSISNPTKDEDRLIRGITRQLATQYRTIPFEDLHSYCFAAYLEQKRDCGEDYSLDVLRFGLRRRALGLMHKDGVVRRSDRESTQAMSVEWPTNEQGEPMDFPDTSQSEETLTETLDGITTLTLREREILYHRHVRGRTREDTKAFMCHGEFDYQMLIKSARTKVKEALTA